MMDSFGPEGYIKLTVRFPDQLRKDLDKIIGTNVEKFSKALESYFSSNDITAPQKYEDYSILGVWIPAEYKAKMNTIPGTIKDIVTRAMELYLSNISVS